MQDFKMGLKKAILKISRIKNKSGYFIFTEDTDWLLKKIVKILEKELK